MHGHVESLGGNSRLAGYLPRNFPREIDGMVSPSGVRDRYDVFMAQYLSGG